MPRYTSRTVPRPFLKWVGGKHQLLPELRKHLPAEITGRYLEPFVGGGALFFDRQPARAVLGDRNAELINCYEVIRDQVDALITELHTHRYEKDYYYAVRAREPAQLDAVARAGRTVFLNKTGFNGLYRVNKKGGFNVPFGRHANPTICDEPNLRACSERLAGVELRQGDFEALIDETGPGDFLYCDPPYVPRSDTSYFTAYQPGGFGWGDQERLATALGRAAARGVVTVASNHDLPEVRDLYALHGLRPHAVQARRNVNSRASARGRVGELILVGPPPPSS